MPAQLTMTLMRLAQDPIGLTCSGRQSGRNSEAIPLTNEVVGPKDILSRSKVVELLRRVSPRLGLDLYKGTWIRATQRLWRYSEGGKNVW